MKSWYLVDDAGVVWHCASSELSNPAEGYHVIEADSYYEPALHVYDFKLKQFLEKSQDLLATETRLAREAHAEIVETRKKKIEELEEAIEKSKGSTKTALRLLVDLLDIK